MATTTQNDPATPKAEAPKLEGNAKKIVDLYVEGKNLYDIAYMVFEFGGDEALEKVRSVLRDEGYLDEGHGQPVTRLIEEV